METLAQILFCEFCKIFKNVFFIKHLQVTASVSIFFKVGSEKKKKGITVKLMKRYS